MEALSGLLVEHLEDATPALGDARRLHETAVRDGFLFFRSLLPCEPLLRLRQVVLDYAREANWLDTAQPLDARHSSDFAFARSGLHVGDYNDPHWVQLQIHVQMSDESRAVGELAEIRRAVAAATGQSSVKLSTANTCRVFSPHSDLATQPHQDAHYVRMLERFWTAWIPLGDCPMELGPLAVLPGSHRDGLRTHANQGIGEASVAVTDDAVWHTTDFCCGDVLLFSHLTLHRALPNTSGNRLRLSADFRYSL